MLRLCKIFNKFIIHGAAMPAIIEFQQILNCAFLKIILPNCPQRLFLYSERLFPFSIQLLSFLHKKQLLQIICNKIALLSTLLRCMNCKQLLAAANLFSKRRQSLQSASTLIPFLCFQFFDLRLHT